MAAPGIFDRVKETTTTTGTGTVTLAGASTGYQSFAVVGDGLTCYYVIASQTLTEWECGIGTYTASGTTLARTTVISSSNSNNAVNFSAGTKDVFISAIASLLTALSSNIINVVIDGGGSAITTGIKLDLEIPFACTITAATMLADQSGSIVIDVWKDTYANYPPTDADSITASAPPTISAALKSQDTTLTGWTKSISAGDTLRFNVDSAATVTRVTLSLKITKP